MLARLSAVQIGCTWMLVARARHAQEQDF